MSLLIARGPWAAPSLVVEWIALSAGAASDTDPADHERSDEVGPVERASEFWSDGEPGLAELAELALRAEVLTETVVARALSGISRAAAVADGVGTRRGALGPVSRERVAVRLRRLAAEPQLRREYLSLVEAIARSHAPSWERNGLARGERAAARLNALEADSFVEVIGRSAAPLRAELSRALSEPDRPTSVLVAPVSLRVPAFVLNLDELLVVAVPADGEGRLDARGAAALARRAKALGDPTRLAILDLLAHRVAGVGDLAVHVGLAQPTVSNHVRVLREAGLVRDLPRDAGRGLTLDRDGLAVLLGQLALLGNED